MEHIGDFFPNVSADAAIEGKHFVNVLHRQSDVIKAFNHGLST
jgi:hypothetical protein